MFVTSGGRSKVSQLAFIVGAATWLFPACTQEEKVHDLRAAVLPGKSSPRLQLEGRAAFPDGTLLTVSLFRVQEQWESGSLVSGVRDPERFTRAKVRAGRIRFGDPWVLQAGGLYRVVIERRSDDEVPLEAWELEVAGWGDDLMSRLGKALLEVDGWNEETLKLVQEIESAAASAVTWESRAEGLREAAGQLIRRLDEGGARHLFPASVGMLRYTIRVLLSLSFFFGFTEEGTPAPLEGYGKMKAAKTFEKEGLSLEALKKEVEKAAALAGREFALWIVRDSRRAGPRDVLREALEAQGGHAGVSPFAERLEKLAQGQAEDLDQLEEALRAPQEQGP
jgi:hypothetical protein